MPTPRLAIEVDPIWYHDWLAERRFHWANFTTRSTPLISVVMPCYNTLPSLLESAIESIIAQTYVNWELCIADDGSTLQQTRRVLEAFEERDARVRVVFLPNNTGIAGASNSALELAQGDLTVLVDHDDELEMHALACLVDYRERHPEAKFFYSDSGRIGAQGERIKPFFKPHWNYDLFLAQNYLNHLTAIETSVLRAVGGWRSGYEGSQDYDLYLRVVETLDRAAICHIPEVLYHWREQSDSFSQSRIAEAVQAARKAVGDHLSRRGLRAEISAPKGALIYNQVLWAPPTNTVKLAIVVHGRYSRGLYDDIEESSRGLAHIRLYLHEIDEHLDGVNGSLNGVVSGLEEMDAVLLLSSSPIELPARVLEQLVARAMHNDVGCVAPKCLDKYGRLLSGPIAGGSVFPPIVRDEPGNSWASDDRGYFNNLLLHQETRSQSSQALAFRLDHYKRYMAASGEQGFNVTDFCRFLTASDLHPVWLGSQSLTFQTGMDFEAVANKKERSQEDPQILSLADSRNAIKWRLTEA